MAGCSRLCRRFIEVLRRAGGCASLGELAGWLRFSYAEAAKAAARLESAGVVRVEGSRVCLVDEAFSDGGGSGYGFVLRNGVLFVVVRAGREPLWRAARRAAKAAARIAAERCRLHAAFSGPRCRLVVPVVVSGRCRGARLVEGVVCVDDTRVVDAESLPTGARSYPVG